MIRLIGVASFALAVATSVHGLTPAPLQLSNGMITQVRHACGAGMHWVNGVGCVTTPRYGVLGTFAVSGVETPHWRLINRKLVGRRFRDGHYAQVISPQGSPPYWWSQTRPLEPVA
jgi:hypothetical protein